MKAGQRCPEDEMRDVTVISWQALETVELIVDEKPLLMPRFTDDEMVPVSVGYEEQELREKLRSMRARWDGQIKVWFVRYGLVRGTELESRIAARNSNGEKPLI